MNFLKSCPNCSSMLRFPASEGTVLVQCPVCSHRFSFSPMTEDQTSFEKEISNPHLPFKPSLKSYLDLCIDILYAPIDYFQSFKKNSGIKFQIVPVLLFSILLLYFWSWSKEDAKPKVKIPLDSEAPIEVPEETDDPPLPSREKAPDFEI